MRRWTSMLSTKKVNNMNNYDYIDIFKGHTRDELRSFWRIREADIRDLAHQRGIFGAYSDIDVFLDLFPDPEEQEDIRTWYYKFLNGLLVSVESVEPLIRLFAEAFAALKIDQDYLVRLKEDTDDEYRHLEARIIGSELFLMRQTAKYFLDQGYKVYFEEHIENSPWAEGGFGDLYIDKENDELFNKLSFLNPLSTVAVDEIEGVKDRRERLIEITKENIEEINYES